MLQMSKNLLDPEFGFLRDKKQVIVDRDTKFSAEFRSTLESEGNGVIRLPPRSPNMNAYAERFVRSVKEECLSKLIPIESQMLRRSLREYSEHYHLERNHQGIGNRTIVPFVVPEGSRVTVVSRHRLGGLLNYHYCAVV